MAENKAKCYDCGVPVTRLIRVRNFFRINKFFDIFLRLICIMLGFNYERNHEIWMFMRGMNCLRVSLIMNPGFVLSCF